MPNLSVFTLKSESSFAHLKLILSQFILAGLWYYIEQLILINHKTFFLQSDNKLFFFYTFYFIL